MGKTVGKVLGVVAAVAAIAIPVVGPAIGLSVMASMAIGTGLALASSVLMGPKIPKTANLSQTTDRLTSSFDLTAARKLVLGTTAMATDIRYHAYSGTNQEYFDQILCVASHEVSAISELWLDNERAWTVGGGVQGRYVGYLTVTPILLGTAANGIAIDSTWTTSCTLTGCAYMRLRFKLTGNSDKVQSPFSGGVTSRVTVRGTGCRVYDPRLDSTVSGGSGSHRANDQATWAFTNNRNPALQLLLYLLGWKVSSKLMVGMGLPPVRIDLPSFITAANICDESVSLSGGGTEPRYLSDGVISEGDDRQSVIESLCATMNAALYDHGGKIALKVVKNDLAAPVATLTLDDIIEDGLWEQTPYLHQTHNKVRGRYINASDTGLYQPVEYPEISLSSVDGIDRIASIDYPFVHSASQAQRLAKQWLQRGQYQGRYTVTLGPRAWQLNVGDVVQWTHGGLGWTNKLFRLVEQTIDQTGRTRCTFLEENSAIYAWAAEESPPVTPGAPTVYDPNNDPLIQGIIEATLNLDAEAVVIFRHASDGTAESGEFPRTKNVKLYGNAALLTTGVTMSYTVISGTVNGFTNASGAQTITVTSGIGAFTISSLGTSTATVQISAGYGSATKTHLVTLRKEFAAAVGASASGGTLPITKNSGFTSFNSTTFASTTGDMTGTMPSGKTTANIAVVLDAEPGSSTAGGWTVEMKVTRGGATIGTVQSASSQVDVELNPTSAAFNFNVNDTGLTAGSSYTWKVEARITSDTRTHYVTGQVTITAP